MVMGASTLHEVIIQTATVQYDLIQPRNNKLVFEADDLPDDDEALNGTVRIRQYPHWVPGMVAPTVIPPLNGSTGGLQYYGNTMSLSSSIYGWKLLTSLGTLYRTGEINSLYVQNSITVSGQDQVDLPYPVVTGLQIYRYGSWFDIYGNDASGVVAIFDAYSQKVYFTKRIYGQLSYSFWTDYNIWRYIPDQAAVEENFYGTDPNRYGSILAFQTNYIDDHPAVQSYPISPPKAHVHDFELYRLVSLSIVNQDKYWEYPTNFPVSGTFPSATDATPGATETKQVDISSGYVVMERVHEIAYVTLSNAENTVPGTKSTDFYTLPIDLFEKQAAAAQLDPDETIRLRNGTRKLLDLQMRNIPRDVRENLSKTVRANVRVQKYAVPLGQPYDARGDPIPDSFVSHGGQVTANPLTAIPDAFLIQLNGVKAKEPFNQPPVRTSNNWNDMSTDIQNQNLNAILNRTWQGINWIQIKDRIIKSYPPQVFKLVLDDLKQGPINRNTSPTGLGTGTGTGSRNST
jgi:hypothetical protein